MHPTTMHNENDRCMTFNIGKSQRKSEVETGRWIGIVPFNSVLGTVPFMRSDISIRPFLAELLWPPRWFHINGFNLSQDENLYTASTIEQIWFATNILWLSIMYSLELGLETVLF